ncbi:hypothetical protein MTR_7g017510 [Medicago truncatula]|uniref:Uncharacterized protein n=1 Tax=Medicago truncatula TaxID=3880 RepID=G7KS08_MEDTR|nr:hypothetical protein MTR_7g017510 [Medicago truncatula]
MTSTPTPPPNYSLVPAPRPAENNRNHNHHNSHKRHKNRWSSSLKSAPVVAAKMHSGMPRVTRNKHVHSNAAEEVLHCLFKAGALILL